MTIGKHTFFSSLKLGECHLWGCSLSEVPERINKCKAYLSAEEIERANRFRFDLHRNRYILARGGLRSLLGMYLEGGPADLEFAYTKHQKPYLSGQYLNTKLQFNVSHSHELAVYAFTLDHPIGVDVEYPRDDFGGIAIAKRFFSSDEYGALINLPLDQQRASFYSAWTRKEAFIKAVGEGLSYPLADFSVSLDPLHEPQIISIRGDYHEAQQWSVASFIPEEKYVAAVVSRQPNMECKFFDFDLRPNE